MKFDKTYCEELNNYITPYYARELYFDENNEYYNVELTFKCPDELCRIDLVGVNIYKSKRSKKALHFRTKPKKIHQCQKGIEKGASSPSDSKAGDEEGFKVTRYPSEFLIERPKVGELFVPEIEDFQVTTDVIISTHSKHPTPSNKKSIIKTSCLDHLVDCYLNGDQNELRMQPLTINGKTKIFFNFFKKIKYYLDEKGLIYWGEVKSIKKYGKNYSIYFEDRPLVGGKKFSVSIYIQNEIIDRYRKKKMFKEQIEGLIEAKEPVLCFFVGTYPVLTDVEGETSFKVLQVNIDNLDHISLTFSKNE